MVNSVLPSRESKRCNLQNVLYMPKLFYNLFSVSVTMERRKTVNLVKTAAKVYIKG